MSRSQLDANRVFQVKTTDAMNRRHDRAVELYESFRGKVYRDPNDRNMFIVPSFSQNGELYKVKRESLNNHSCNVYCAECEACVHEFSCSCPDYVTKASFCKHMHIVCIESPEEISDNLSVSDESNRLREIIRRNFRFDPNEKLRQKAERAVERLVSNWGDYTSPETFKEIIKAMKELDSKIQRIEDHETIVDPSS